MPAPTSNSDVAAITGAERPLPFLPMVYSRAGANGAGVLSTDVPGDLAQDANGVWNVNGLRTGLMSAPNRALISPTAFWSAAVVGALAFSPAFSTGGNWGKGKIYVQSTIANTFNVQYSTDGGTTWFMLTQDNAGTFFIIAVTAGQLLTVRDLPGAPATTIRLQAVLAATVTAGIELTGV